MVYVVKSVSEFERYRQSTKYKFVVLMLSGKQCGPCHQITPFVEQLSQQYKSILFLKALNDEVPQLFAQCTGMPAFLFFKQGKKVYEFTGANNNQLNDAVRYCARAQ